VNRWNSSGASKTAGSTDNGGQKNNTNPSSAWNFSGHKPQNSTSSDSGAARTNGGSQWGDWDSNDKGKAKQSNSSSTGGWGTEDGWGGGGGGGGGWANAAGNSKDSPAENTGGGSWSALPGRPDDSSNANSHKENDWNSGTGRDGAASSWHFSGGGEWGQPSGESHTKDKGKEADDVRMRTSSPQMKATFSATSSPQKKALNSDLPRLQPTSPSLQNTPESAGYVPMSSMATGTDSSGKLKKEVLEVAKLDLSQDKMKTLKYRGPAGRKTLYTHTVKSVKCNCPV